MLRYSILDADAKRMME